MCLPAKADENDDDARYLNDDELEFIKQAEAAYERLRQDPEALALGKERLDRWSRLILSDAADENWGEPTAAGS